MISHTDVGGWGLLQYHGGDNSIKIDRDETYRFLITLGINVLCIKLANSLRCSTHRCCLHGLLQVNSTLELCYILVIKDSIGLQMQE